MRLRQVGRLEAQTGRVRGDGENVAVVGGEASRQVRSANLGTQDGGRRRGIRVFARLSRGRSTVRGTSGGCWRRVHPGGIRRSLSTVAGHHAIATEYGGAHN
jgi:hypothetical protein